jgi:tetratricopeptide (TPR) repeat protein
VELDDHAGQGATLHCLGFCCQKLGQYHKAMELFEQALAIDIELGDRAGQGATLNRLGNCYHRLGQYARSMELFEQSSAISEELGDRAGQAGEDAPRSGQLLRVARSVRQGDRFVLAVLGF